jgi:hypothetical protein
MWRTIYSFSYSGSCSVNRKPGVNKHVQAQTWTIWPLSHVGSWWSYYFWVPHWVAEAPSSLNGSSACSSSTSILLLHSFLYPWYTSCTSNSASASICRQSSLCCWVWEKLRIGNNQWDWLLNHVTQSTTWTPYTGDVLIIWTFTVGESGE